MKKRYGLSGEKMMLLRRVESEAIVTNKPVKMIRIFNPATSMEKRVNIEDYKSLDNHPDLILYEGYYYTEKGEITDGEIEKK
jgi:hypothetical protein